MKENNSLSRILAQYRNGERGLPTYEELQQMAGSGAEKKNPADAEIAESGAVLGSSVAQGGAAPTDAPDNALIDAVAMRYDLYAIQDGGRLDRDDLHDFVHGLFKELASQRAAAPVSGDLPELPHTNYNGYSDGSEPLYTAEQMRDYARAAVSAATKPTAGLPPLPYSKAKSRALIVKGDIVFSVDEVEQIQREAYEFGKAQATAAVESIADELTDEAIPYEGDFADTVRGCADALRDLMRYEVVKLRDGLCEVPAPNTGSYVKFADVQSLLATKPAHRPTDDHLWDETIRDRDTYHEWADKLAEAISKHFDAYIGEHSNTNCPWAEALEAIEAATKPAAPAVPVDAVIEAREQALTRNECDLALRWLDVTRLYSFVQPEDDVLIDKLNKIRAGAEGAE